MQRPRCFVQRTTSAGCVRTALRAQARRQAPDLAVSGVASHCEHLGLLSALASSGASNGAGVAIGRPLSSILIMRGIKIHFPLLRSKQPIRDGYAGFSVDAASRLVRHGWLASSPVLLRAAEGWMARPSATPAKEVHRTTLGERPPVGIRARTRHQGLVAVAVFPLGPQPPEVLHRRRCAGSTSARMPPISIDNALW